MFEFTQADNLVCKTIQTNKISSALNQQCSGQTVYMKGPKGDKGEPTKLFINSQNATSGLNNSLANEIILSSEQIKSIKHNLTGKICF